MTRAVTHHTSTTSTVGPARRCRRGAPRFLPRPPSRFLRLVVTGHGSEQKQASISLNASAGILCRRCRLRVSATFLILINRLYDNIPSASGFTTRSDIGPAREGPSAEAIA